MIRTIALIPLADAALLSFTAPVFVPILGILLFRFAVDGRVLLAVFVGFLGVSLVLQPSTGVFGNGAGVGMLSGVFGGLSIVLLWRMQGTEQPGRIAFVFSLTGALVSAVPMVLSGKWPVESDWITLLALGVCSTLAVLLLAWGCMIAPGRSRDFAGLYRCHFCVSTGMASLA